MVEETSVRVEKTSVRVEKTLVRVKKPQISSVKLVEHLEIVSFPN